jgi:hypothetical protein
LAIAWLGPVLALVGCSKGCGHDRPYTPYVIEAGPTGVAPARAAELSDAGPVLGGGDAGFFHVVGQPALLGDGGVFALEGGASIEPPPGERFLSVLAADLDDDGAKDAVAWVTSGDPLAGRLLFYKGGAVPSVPKPVAALAPLALGVPGCGVEPVLEQIGPHTVAMSVRTMCTPRAPADKKVRWIAVATPGREPALREELRLGAPADGEQLRIEMDAADQDGDGRDDLAARFVLEGAAAPFEPGPEVLGALRWFDRPTGLSRDPEEPEKSLRAAASRELARAAKKSDAMSAAYGARQIERLYQLLCSDAGAPLLTLSGGAVRCGTSQALEDAAATRVKAALTVGDVPRALSAYQRAGWRPATTRRKKELEKWILKAAPAQTPGMVRVFAAVPDEAPSGVPAWGPLTFMPTGDLLVRTKAGVSTVNLETGTEGSAAGIPSWPMAVTSPDGAARWLGLFDACDGATLGVRFGGAGDAAFAVPPSAAPGRQVAVPVSPPIPGRCAPGARELSLDPIAIAWGGAGLEAWVAGEPMLLTPDLQAKPLLHDASLGQPAHAGSPRSSDGRSFAIGTPLGALVRTAKGYQLWRPADLAGAYAYGNLHGCTAANDARAVACVRDGRVLGMTPPAPR